MAVRKRVKITVVYADGRKRILDGLTVVLPGHEYAGVVAHRALEPTGQTGRAYWSISEPRTGRRVSIMDVTKIEVAISMAANRLSDLKMNKKDWDENIERNLAKAGKE